MAGDPTPAGQRPLSRGKDGPHSKVEVNIDNLNCWGEGTPMESANATEYHGYILDSRGRGAYSKWERLSTTLHIA